ncbi:hypothetical protein [Paenibacillus sp. V4I3]|uniref:hypothetical protein n=1 Tax=Paenibacillus sp. V4I3 TaxID=3042305 RepID=UPI0027D7C7E7|nr:hypothetical protein [Paenibacillus sp. V4I3]
MRTLLYVILGCIGGMFLVLLLIFAKALFNAGIEAIFPHSNAQLILGIIVLGLVVIYFIWKKKRH